MRIKLLAVLLVCASGSVFGQSDFQVGVRAGWNYIQTRFDPTIPTIVEYDYRSGYHFGIATKFNLGREFYLNPELLYNNKGYSRGAFNDGLPRSESNTHLNYVSLPILLEYRPQTWLGLQAGPEIGFLASARTKFEDFTWDLLDQEEIGLLDLNRLDLGLAIGAAFLIDSKLTGSLRYVHGMRQLYESPPILFDLEGNALAFEGDNYFNRAFQVSLVYWIW